MKNAIPKQAFGKTGHQSSRIVFGGALLKPSSEADAEKVLRLLQDFGVNHLDTSITYGNSEKLIGKWMRDYRKDFFLATKIDSRTYTEAHAELETSLRDLQTDQFDLLQMHELVEDADTDTFLSPKGALRVLTEAKEQGLTRFVGVTSHGFNAPRILQRCLREYPFDSVLLPFNYALSIHPEYRPEFDALMKVCDQRGIAVQTIKSIARGAWGNTPRNRGTWYQPLENPEDIALAVHYVMSFEKLFLASAGDIDLLPLVLKAAAEYAGAPVRSEVDRMAARTGLAVIDQNKWPRLWGENGAF